MEWKIYEVKHEDFHDCMYEFCNPGRGGSEKRTVLFYRSKLFPASFYDMFLSDYFLVKDDEGTNRNGRSILPTVIAIVRDFMEKNPSAILHFLGATPTLKRLYQMTVKSLNEDLSKEYFVYGRSYGKWEALEEDASYDEYLFFKRNYEIVYSVRNRKPEDDIAPTREVKALITWRNNPMRQAKEKLYLKCLQSDPFPEVLQCRLGAMNDFSSAGMKN